MPPLLTVIEGTAGLSLNDNVAGNSKNAGELQFEGQPIREWLQHHHRKQLTLLDKFLLDLKFGQQSTSQSTSTSLAADRLHDSRLVVVLKTMEVLRYFIGSTRWKTAAQVLTLLRWIGHEMSRTISNAQEPALGNVVRRLMAAVREEVVREDSEKQQQMQQSSKTTTITNTTATATTSSTMTSIGGASSSDSNTASDALWSLPQPRRDRQDSISASETDIFASSSYSVYPPSFYQVRPELKQALMEAMEEFMNDVQDLHKNINEQAVNHIHSGEVLLTCGHSKSVELFLRAAHAKKRSFHVLVVDSPGLAHSLQKANIAATVTQISFAAVFCLMPRVHKVILPAHAVLANGGLVAKRGSQLIALAAAHHAVPTLVLTGLYKLCPIFPHEGPDTLNELKSPDSTQLVDYTTAHNPIWNQVELVQPEYDYIKPEHVRLYVTNVGAFQPSFIYRLLADYYHADDWDSF